MARIIDLTGLTGAYATRLFAEQGHEVIRIESPEGDGLRRLPPFLGDKQDLEHGAYHQFLNAGKKSLALNLDSPAGQKIFLELASQSDALVSDDSLPLEDRLLFEANPKLVITQIQNQEPEICAVARSGLMSLTGQPGQAPAILGAHVPVSGSRNLHRRRHCRRPSDSRRKLEKDPSPRSPYVKPWRVSWSRRWWNTVSPVRSPSAGEAKERSPPFPEHSRARTATG